MLKKYVIWGSIFACLAVLAVGVLFVRVPFNMDEFIHYHTIICHEYPNNRFNLMREACSSYDLAVIPGHYWPLRTYDYSGSFLSVLYYPLFKIWPSPYSARFLGVIFLFLQACLLARFFRSRSWVFFIIFLSCMPYAWQNMVDTGPVGFHLTVIFALFILCREWAASLASGARNSWLYAVLMGALVFLCVWVKLFFIILIPALIVASVYFVWAGSSGFDGIKRKWLQILRDVVGGAVACLVPLGLLLNAPDRSGMPYYKNLFIHGPGYTGENAGLWEQFARLSRYFTNPLRSAHRIFDDPRMITPEGVAGMILLLAFLVFGLYQMARQGKKTGFVWLNLGLFAGTFFLMVMNRDVWAMHHIVLSCAFLWMAVFAILSALGFQKWILGIGVGFLLVNASLYYQAARSAPLQDSHPSRLRINEVLNTKYSNEYIFVVVDWGMYYLKGLYGAKDQCVIYMEPFPGNPVYLEFLKRLVSATHRKLMFIGVDGSSSAKVISRQFPALDLGFDTGSWRVWYQP